MHFPFERQISCSVLAQPNLWSTITRSLSLRLTKLVSTIWTKHCLESDSWLSDDPKPGNPRKPISVRDTPCSISIHAFNLQLQDSFVRVTLHKLSPHARQIPLEIVDRQPTLQWLGLHAPQQHKEHVHFASVGRCFLLAVSSTARILIVSATPAIGYTCVQCSSQLLCRVKLWSTFASEVIDQSSNL